MAGKLSEQMSKLGSVQMTELTATVDSLSEKVARNYTELRDAQDKTLSLENMKDQLVTEVQAKQNQLVSEMKAHQEQIMSFLMRRKDSASEPAAVRRQEDSNTPPANTVLGECIPAAILSPRPRTVHSTTGPAGVLGELRHASALGDRYIEGESDRGSGVGTDRSEEARINTMRDGIVKAYIQFAKESPDTTKPSSWNTYVRDVVQAADLWTFREGLTGDDELSIDPFDFDSLSRQYPLRKIHNHQLAFNFLINTITDATLKNKVYQAGSPTVGWRRLQSFFQPKTVTEVEDPRQRFYAHQMQKRGNPLEAEAFLQQIESNIKAIDLNHSISNQECNGRLLNSMPSAEYSDVPTYFSTELGPDTRREKVMSKLTARYNYLQRNKRNSTASGGALCRTSGKQELQYNFNGGQRGRGHDARGRGRGRGAFSGGRGSQAHPGEQDNNGSRSTTGRRGTADCRYFCVNGRKWWLLGLQTSWTPGGALPAALGLRQMSSPWTQDKGLRYSTGNVCGDTGDAGEAARTGDVDRGPRRRRGKPVFPYIHTTGVRVCYNRGYDIGRTQDCQAWVADSGASKSMTPSTDCMINFEECDTFMDNVNGSRFPT